MTDTKEISFKALNIKNFKSNDFIHEITYNLYLAEDFKVMRFLKNCDDFLIEKAFVKP